MEIRPSPCGSTSTQSDSDLSSQLATPPGTPGVSQGQPADPGTLLWKFGPVPAGARALRAILTYLGSLQRRPGHRGSPRASPPIPALSYGNSAKSLREHEHSERF